MEEQSLIKIMTALTRLDQELGSIANDLRSKIESYRSIVESIHGQGLAGEVYSQYMSQYFPEDKYHIDQLVHHIEASDVPYIKEMIAKVQATIGAAEGAR